MHQFKECSTITRRKHSTLKILAGISTQPGLWVYQLEVPEVRIEVKCLEIPGFKSIKRRTT